MIFLTMTDAALYLKKYKILPYNVLEKPVSVDTLFYLDLLVKNVSRREIIKF